MDSRSPSDRRRISRSYSKTKKRYSSPRSDRGNSGKRDKYYDRDQDYRDNRGGGGYNNYKDNNYGNNRYSGGGGGNHYPEHKKFTHLTLRRYRNPGESLIRVHFFIRDVYVKNGDAESFIFITKDRIQKCGDVDVLQMLNHNKDQTFTDLAIGMRYDKDAKKVADGVRVIKLLDKSGKLLNQSIEVSQLFKRQLLEQDGLDKPFKKEKTKKSRSRSRSERKKQLKTKQSASSSPSEPKEKVKPFFEQKLFFFGIPEEFNESDVIESVAKKGVNIIEHKWEQHKSMSYLSVNVKNEIQYTQLQNEDIFLEKDMKNQYGEDVKIQIPLLIMADQVGINLEDALQTYQVRLEYTSQISAITLYQMFKRYGTIVNLFQDNQSLQIIYSKPHEKLNIKVPQQLNVILPDPYTEVQIDIKIANSFEKIERQELIKTIQYQIQILQSNKQSAMNQTQKSQQQTQEKPKQTDSEVEDNNNINNNANTNNNNNENNNDRSPEQRRDSYQRSLSQSSNNSNNKKMSRSKSSSRQSSRNKKPLDHQDTRRDDYLRKKSFSDRDDRYGSYDNKPRYQNNRSGGGYDNYDRRKNQGTNYGKQFNNYNSQHYNYTQNNMKGPQGSGGYNNRGYNQNKKYRR